MQEKKKEKRKWTKKGEEISEIEKRRNRIEEKRREEGHKEENREE